MANVSLKPWREIITPHRDIREGRFDESTFAADLADVLAERGPLEYRDPDIFFRKTYPTEGLIRILARIVARLAGKRGEQPIIQIQTPFGGGKTHSLIALYHLLTSGNKYKHLDLVKRVLDEAGVDALPEVGVAVFVGTEADPLKGKTPWGLIAEQLGRYTLLQEHDQMRQSPGKDLLHQLFDDQPVLILMDEIAQYVVRCVNPETLRKTGDEAARAYQTQVLAFFQELTETVKVLPRAAMVVTLPSSAPYGEEGERVLDQLNRIFGRMETIYEPVRGEEIYEVIRRRLFEFTGFRELEAARRTAEAYFYLYQRLGEEVPARMREPSYREKLYRAYPFHPELIDIFHERWSTLPTFQRTRHVLWLMGEIVSDLYRREHSAPLIQPAHVNLANPAIRTKLIQHIGQEYNSVISADIADTNAKAQAIDRRMGSEFARFSVATGLATSIFLYSFSGGEERSKGAGLPELRVALLREGIPASIVADALRKLEDELWYLHVESGRYRFTSQPNLNRIIIEREDLISEEHIEKEFRDQIERIAGKELKVFLFPQGPEDVPDTRDLKLAVLESGSDEVIRNLLKRSGGTFRVYQNTLLILTPDPGALSDLRREIKRYLALRSIYEDKTLRKHLSEENKGTLKERLEDAKNRVPFRIFSSYRYLYIAGSGEHGFEKYNLGLPTVGERTTLAKRVLYYLKAQDLLLDRIKPEKLLSNGLGKDETEKPLKEIYEAYLKYPHLPLLEGEWVLRESVKEGVQKGVFGLRIGERTYFREELPSFDLDEAVLVRREAVQMGEETREPDHTPDISQAGEVWLQEHEDWYISQKPPTPSQEGPRSLTLRVQIPWNKLSDFLRGVVMPLHRDGATLTIEILLQARSDTEFRKSTRDTVEETLSQIGGKIKEKRFG